MSPSIPDDVVLAKAVRRIDPSADERAWFGLPAFSGRRRRAAFAKAATSGGSGSEVYRKLREIQVRDVWFEVPIGDQWRAAMRLMPYKGQPVVAELRLFPRDEWPTRKPGEWRAEFLGVHAGRVVGVRTGRSTNILGRPLNRPARSSTLDAATFASIRPGITARLVHNIKFGEKLGFGREFIEAIRQVWAKSYKDAGGEPEPFPEFRTATTRPRAKGRKSSVVAWPDVRYARIAAQYLSRIEAGSRRPVFDVAEASRGKLTAPQVRDAIHTARKRGLLTPTEQGSPGGQLTTAAEDLIRAQRRGHKREKGQR